MQDFIIKVLAEEHLRIETADNWNSDKPKAVYREFAQAIPNAFAIEKSGVAPCKNACPVDTSAHDGSGSH